jgi:hypothetical protein
LYTKAARVTFVTLKPTLVVFLGIPDQITAHWPSAFVMHMPLVPSFQRPLTAALTANFQAR